jgi:hypothetical protein
MPSRFVASCVPLLVLAAGCAPTNASSFDPGPDRILSVSADGRVLRQATGDEGTRATFSARKDRVWKALMATYADLGITPTVADAATGQYGSMAFVVPRRLASRPIGQFFHCGSSFTGASVDNGQVTAVVLTTLTPLSDSTTSAATQVRGTLRPNDGSSGGVSACTTTGALEEHLRKAIEKQLTPAP